MQTIFETERLLFREFTMDDAGLIYDLNSDPVVTQYVHEPPTTIENAPVVLANIILPQYKKYNHGRWAVHLKNTHEFIGWCGLKRMPEHTFPDLGFRYFKKYWGNGYATEAAKKTIGYGFNTLKLPGIFAAAHVDNTGSINVLEKCGMKYLGTEETDGILAKTYELLNE